MEGVTGEVPTITQKLLNIKFSGKKFFVYILITGLAITFAYVHYKYVSTLFENDKNFSYLSNLEREMSLRTEMGFYYSYYKTIVEEKSFMDGISKLMYDRLVEYPKDVNAFNRFNIYPEVIIGSLYRYFEPLLNTVEYKECHMVERGEGHSPVESCIGLGQPIFFYLEAIWCFAGLTVAVLFLQATVLSQNILGGFMAVLQYFTNHAECTRVQWSPNERENLVAPLLLLQSWLLVLQLRNKTTVLQLQLSIYVLNCLCLLFWQFTQFIFLTQVAIFFVMEQLRIIDIKSLTMFLHCHFCGLHTVVLLIQGNDMLKSSLFTCYYFMVSIYCLFFSSLRIKIQNRLDLFLESCLVALRVLVSIFGAFYLKKILSDTLDIQEDSHVWDILYSKFTDYENFHTLIYTCSEVFDFLPISSIINMTKSLLIPMVLLVSVKSVDYWLYGSFARCMKEIDDYNEIVARDVEDTRKERGGAAEDDDSGIENNTETVKHPKHTDLMVWKAKCKDAFKKGALIMYFKNLEIEPAVFYTISQMVVYAVMAGLVMRLKMLLSTQMCIVSSLVANKSCNVLPKSKAKYVPIFWTIAIIPVLRELSLNVTKEMSYVGQFSDYRQEELLQWISKEAEYGAFAGSMPISATVMLTTRRPIITHPHYENMEARQRAHTVYKMYGKFSAQHLYQELTKLRATYLIVETKYCYGKSARGCTFESIWDVEMPALKSNPKICHVLLTEPVDHFYPVFRNEHYAVFRIHDISLRYMPRSFDT